MLETNLFIKLFGVKTGNVYKFLATRVTLKKPIRYARFFEVHTSFKSGETPTFVRCSLADEGFNLSNVLGHGNYGLGPFAQSNICAISYGGGAPLSNKVRINDSKSLVNNLEVEVSFLKDVHFSQEQADNAFIHLKIYHEAP